jgi:hypothetical protein
MAGRRMSDGISELLGKENLSKGVSVTIEGDDVYVDLTIVVGYGVRISEGARMGVDKVRYTLENATGLSVKKVTLTFGSKGTRALWKLKLARVLDGPISRIIIEQGKYLSPADGS